MRIKKAAILAFALALVIGTGAMSVSAAGYELTVYSGNGNFAGDDSLKGTSVSVDDSAATVSVDGGSAVEIKMPDGKAASKSKYFVRGVKLTGHDNSEVITGAIDLTSESSPVKNQDASVVVAYGLKSNMTKYTIRYIDAASGSELLSSETHYGVRGDKPVVSYKYVDGYLPNAWNETATIADDGSTVFTFSYYEVDNEGNVIIVNDGTDNAGNGAGNTDNGVAGTNDAGAGTAAGDGNGADIGDNGVPLADGPADLVDLDEGDTPHAAPEGSEETGGVSKAVIAGAVAVVAAAAAAVAIVRRRREYEYEDDDETDE